MKSLGNFPDPFLAEIVGQPAALDRAAGAIEAQVAALAALSTRAGDPRGGAGPVFTGMGASYFACYPAVTALAGAGIPAHMVDAAELLHFRQPALRGGEVVVAVSQSGRSAEVVRLAEALRDRGPHRPFVVAVTNGPDNPLAVLADLALDTVAGEEVGPSTLSFAAALTVLGAVAGALAGEAPDAAAARTAREARAAAAAAATLLAAPEGLAGRLRDWIGDRTALMALGRGAARAAAEMGALVLKEAARFGAESLEGAQFRHGPLELAGPALAVAVVATEEATRSLDVGVAAEMVGAGAAVLVVTADGDVPEGAFGVPLPPLAPAVAPAVAVIPFQLLAWRLAVDRGLDPAHISTATKVTARE
jgi:glucosamine--fructose-6-phosphate aminotransferase (isomerizing)